MIKCVIAASVAKKVEGISDCVEGAHVTLSKDGKKIEELITDNYGDFKFDGLEGNVLSAFDISRLIVQGGNGRA